MTKENIITMFNETILVAFKLSLPILLISLAIGLIISIFQAATQIHEQTITFIPKIIVLGVVFILLGPWMMRISVEFFNKIFKFMLETIK